MTAPVRGSFVDISVAVDHGYGDKCYDCEAFAVTALITESDSMGSEYHPLCTSCGDKTLLKIKEAREKEEANPTGYCDWCKASNVLVSPHRDFEEGLHGRVYDVCSPCLAKERERIAEEMEDYEYDNDDWIGWCD